MDGTQLELLTPFADQRFEQLDEDTQQWRHVPDLPELVLEVTPASAP